MDSYVDDHLMGPRPEVGIMPMMAAIAARASVSNSPSVMNVVPLRHPIPVWRKKWRHWTFWRRPRDMAVGWGRRARSRCVERPVKQRGAMTDEGMAIYGSLWVARRQP